MLKLAYGGSFNPIHNGHLICARAAAIAGGFERVVLIPSAQPPHKVADSRMASPQQRLRMAQLAADTDPSLFEVNDLELHRNGPSYTLDTARELKRAGWSSVNWLIGADMLQNLPHWHESRTLLADVRFVVMARPGFPFTWDTLPQEYRRLQDNVVQTPLVDISATDLRRRIADGRPVTDLTPPAVAGYIAEEGLYQARSI